MFNKAKPRADAFAFSLGGMTTIAAFAAVPVIADDRINRIRDARQNRDCNHSDPDSREMRSIYSAVRLW